MERKFFVDDPKFQQRLYEKRKTREMKNSRRIALTADNCFEMR